MPDAVPGALPVARVAGQTASRQFARPRDAVGTPPIASSTCIATDGWPRSFTPDRPFASLGRVFTLTVALGGLLAGCASAPEIPLIPKLPAPKVIVETVYVPVYIEKQLPEPEPVVVREPARLPEEQEQALALLSEMVRSSQLGAEELRREFASAAAAFGRERTPVNRLRLVWLSVLLGPAAGDDARLQGLLDPLIGRNGALPLTHPLRAVAELVQASLNERIRQVREEARKADALQQKLDALRAIERQLLDRERRRN